MRRRQTAMIHVLIAALLLLGALLLPARAEDAFEDNERTDGLAVGPLKFPEVSDAPSRVRQMLHEAVNLTRRGYKYIYGAEHPRDGGFDCSGMVHYLLLKMGAPNVPRQADTLRDWLRQKDAFCPLREDPDLDGLEPGDLLFWSGTYRAGRDVTHVMIYLGTDAVTGERWMVGASSRSRGIDLFRFDPGRGDGAGERFLGFGKIGAFFPR